MRQYMQNIHIGNYVLDLVKLPEAAQKELAAFYEFLIFKYQGQTDTAQFDKQRILSQIFQEAEGILPDHYSFEREVLHER